jgi:hypothetical protein
MPEQTDKTNRSYKIFSILLMILGIVIFSLVLSYNPMDYSLNSTSLYANNWNFYAYRNTVSDLLVQIFGISVYLLPIIMMVWSYKLFLGHGFRFLGLRIFLLIFALLIMPGVIYVDFNEYSAGLIGLFLTQHFDFFYDYDYIVWAFLIVAIAFVSAIKVVEVISVYFAIIMSLSYVWNAFIRLKEKIFKPKVPRESNVLMENSILRVTPDLNLIAKNTSIPEKGDGIISDIDIDDDIPFEESPLMASQSTGQSINTEEPIVNNTTKITPKLQKPKSVDDYGNFSGDNITVEDFSNYGVSLDYLEIKAGTGATISAKEAKENALKLETIIKEFGINGKIVNIKTGPVVTLYEISIPAGVKTSKLIALETDIALRMKAVSVRIAVVSGKDVIGIEIPNKNRKTIYLKEIFQSKEFINTTAKLPMALGYDIYGNSVVADLVTMPHVLIAGTTGSGKSVGVNSMILSMLYKLPPDQCKLIMIDPKMLELSVYQDIPHLLSPVVTNPKQAVSTLKWVVKEMEYRYYQMSLLGVRNVIGFNEKVQDQAGIEAFQRKILEEKQVSIKFNYMPYIVVIIDEMADLMIVAGKEVESAVQRLAQMARASGIHLIMATQRPSVDVITGTIKANFPTRISFQVSSKIDSRTILGEQGAEQLLGRGDMLYMSGVGRIQRVHGPFVADEEVSKVVAYLKTLGKPNYIQTTVGAADSEDSSGELSEKDELYEEAIAVIQEEGKVSTSFLQRKFQIGYNRAARIVEQLEENGIVSKASVTGKREILVK